VDSGTEVLRIAASVIQLPPSRVAGTRTDLIKGVGKIAERLLIVLNLEKILTTEERIALDEVTLNDMEEAEA
jgi:purine-binding chemotaxis protein CheW